MKKLIVLMVLVMMFSCDNLPMEESVNNKKAFTTVEKLEMNRDTIIISIDDDNMMYVWEDELIVGKYIAERGDRVSINVMAFGFILSCFLVIGLIVSVFN